MSKEYDNLSLKEKISDIYEHSNNELEKYVCDYITGRYSDDEEIIGFFEDLSTSGCCSGFVVGLKNWSETHNFFDKFYDEIEEMRDEYFEQTGDPFEIPGSSDLKNTLACFGFEQMANMMAYEIGVKV